MWTGKGSERKNVLQRKKWQNRGTEKQNKK